MKKKDRRRRPRRATGRPGRSQPQYSIATIAYYGPDDQTVTKIAVGIIESEDAEPIMKNKRPFDERDYIRKLRRLMR